MEVPIIRITVSWIYIGVPLFWETTTSRKCLQSSQNGLLGLVLMLPFDCIDLDTKTGARTCPLDPTPYTQTLNSEP